MVGKAMGVLVMCTGLAGTLLGSSQAYATAKAPQFSLSSGAAPAPVSSSEISGSQLQFTQSAKSLLVRYGWHPNFVKEKVEPLTLPESYTDVPGAYPIGLYWAYHNVLSSSIGLNMTRYLGAKVVAYIVPVQHWHTGVAALDDNRTTYAILVKQGTHLIGAWISQGLRDSDYAMSLSKRFFAQLTRQTWGEWLVNRGLVNEHSRSYVARRSLTAPQVIKAFFQAMNNHRDRLTRSYMTEYSLYEEMTTNLPQANWLYNPGFGAENDLAANMKSVRVTSVKQNKLPSFSGNNIYPTVKREMSTQRDLFNMTTYGRREYDVGVVQTWYHVTASNNGPGGWFVELVRETPHGPWLVSSLGTGP